jgi:hypothetical protein
MRISRWLVLGAALVAATVVSGTALGVGPWPGLARTVRAPSGDVRYSASTAGSTTTVKAVNAGSVVHSATFDGAYGIPAVTSTGLAGGLSPDGSLLVLAEPPNYEGLRERSRFLVLSTDTLSRVAAIVLGGEFGFDAISPDRGTLYLIQHTSSRDLVRYVVHAYDLRAGRLLPGAIVDKRAPGEAMRGYPVARATSARGAWVYTLYNRATAGGRPFVHALNAAGRSAFCIDLPRWPSTTNIWNARLALTDGDRRLTVRAPGGVTVARIDTKTLRLQ